MAPIIIIINPIAAHRVKYPISRAVAPNGSAIERSLVVNNIKADIPSGAPDQKGNL